MQSSPSKVIIASAGSGKTTLLVKEALSRPTERIAVLTYTNNNVGVLKNTFCRESGGVPSEVDIRTWFSFLLHECARPYQRTVYSRKRLKGIHFSKGRSSKYVPKTDIQKYYFKNGNEIYADKISEFILECEKGSGGCMTSRLREVYDAILVDEMQDLAGYDLDILETLMHAGMRMVMVGDPRQTTYITNQSLKNRQYRGVGFFDKVQQWKSMGLCELDVHTESYRCNQRICDFADRLWPAMDKTVSRNDIATGHDGIFLVSRADVHAYIEAFLPIVLRYSRKTETNGYPAVNFGNAKGMTFDRVLILPHGPIRKYLRTGDLSEVSGSLSKFYVAVTRARHSVAFVYDNECWGDFVRWKPNGTE